MKTRQQRLAEERAGHPPSPPQSLPISQRGPRRARSKTPSATVAAGSVVPAAQSGALGEPQALLRVWVDVGPELSGRVVNDPTHQVAFDSSLLPEVIGFLESIGNSNKSSTSHQGIPEQEAIKPNEPEHATTGKPTKRRKNAFRRNPLMGISASGLKSLPVPASVDESSADNIPMIFRHDFDFAATPISQKPNKKPSTYEDSRMVDASESGSMIGPSTKISHQADVPETPRSKWGLGGLWQSARSITRRLAFSPLAPVQESNEASPQMASTESSAPTQPKRRASAPISARDKRAKSRRQNDSAVNSSNASRRNEQAQAKRATQASSETNAIGAEDEGFPAMGSTSPENHEEEARQAEFREPAAGPTTRWPSRSLDRMKANKRKREGDPLGTPGTEAGGHGQGATEGQPVKRCRTSESGGLTSEAAGHQNTARPSTGSKFQPSAVEWQGGNVFAEDQAARQQSLPKTPIPITNPMGTFKVPSPGDSDWSDSGSDEDEGGNAGLGGVTPSRTGNVGVGFGGPSNPRQTLRPAEAEALRKAREKSQKYKPGKSSRLSHSIKAYPSPPRANERQSEPSGPARFNAFEYWCKTAPPAVTAAIEKMNVDSNMAGNAVEAALGNRGTGRATQYNAYEEWCRTAPPAVTAILEQMEVDSNIAGQAFVSGLDKFTEQK